MPDLEATFEIGPQMDITFWRSENRARFVKLLLPLRAAITVQGSPKDIGFVFHPKLNMDITDLPGMPGWNLGMLAGPLFGAKRQHACADMREAHRPHSERQNRDFGREFAGPTLHARPKVNEPSGDDAYLDQI